jgi:hypothetical protein
VAATVPPFPRGPFRLRVGARALDPAEWLVVDERRADDLALKARLLAQRPRDLLAWLPGTEDAAREVLDEVVRSLRADHGITAEPDDSLHPIDAAGRLVQEDLCLHVERDGRLVLAATSVCFPAKWTVADKIGRPITAIHDPVPGYAASIGGAVDRVVDALSPDRGIWRTNWSVNTSGDLCQPRRASRPERVEPADLWLRVERQTLRRLPRHGSVLFTIRTFQWQLRDLDAETRVGLAAAIRALPPDILAYKDLTDLATPALAWLDT